MTTVFIEDSTTPIYNRIVQSIAAALERHGMSVTLLARREINLNSFEQFLSRRADDVYLSTAADVNMIQKRIPGKTEHFFERFPGRIVFLHHDSMLSSVFDREEALSRWTAWRSVATRSYHLCIEAGNIETLRLIGVENATLIGHATEIPLAEPLLDEPQYSVSFVGHVIPWKVGVLTPDPCLNARLSDLLTRRRTDFAYPLQSEIALGCLDLPEGDIVATIAYQQWTRALLNMQSVPFRGGVLEEARLPSIALFGGDPGYLHNLDLDRRLDMPGVCYHPPVYDVNQVREIYRGSAVSLNISSPQFDYAVPNRFHDVVMSGGLCLTDRRSGLADLTRYHDEVSYSSIGELRDKALYFSRPENRRTRARLIRALQKDVAESSSYDRLAQTIVDAIRETSPLERRRSG
jgi:hypothetical protein